MKGGILTPLKLNSLFHLNFIPNLQKMNIFIPNLLIPLKLNSLFNPNLISNLEKMNVFILNF
jgi:hypothetical protein